MNKLRREAYIRLPTGEVKIRSLSDIIRELVLKGYEARMHE